MSGVDPADVEVLAGLYAERLQLLDHRTVGGGRRVVLHQPRKATEVFAGIHLLHLNERRGLRVDACGDGTLAGGV